MKQHLTETRHKNGSLSSPLCRRWGNSISWRIAALLCAALAQFSPQSLHADEPISFRAQIAPILVQHCVACHGPKNAKGNYRLDNYELALGAGDSATAAFAPRDLEGSEALRRIESDDPKERMPLDGDPLPKEQIELLRRWISAGATFDGPNPKSPLATIVPPPTYADPPASYPRPLPITALAFNAAGDELYASGYHEVTVWSVADGRLLRRIKNMPQRIYSLSLTGDGKTLIVAGGTPGRLGEVRLVDAATGNLLRVLNSTSDVVFDAALNPAGDRLAAAGADCQIRIFEMSTGNQQLAIESHADWVFGLAWNHDGTRLASAARDKSAKLFDAVTGELLITYAGHAAPVVGVSFSSDGSEVLSAGEDQKVHRWTIADAKKVGDLAELEALPLRLATSGEALFVLAATGNVRELNRTTRAAVRTYGPHAEWPQSAARHAATNRLAIGTFSGEIRIWNTADGAAVSMFVASPMTK